MQSRHALRSHVETVHMKIKPFSCEECDTSFAKESRLRHHVESCHLGGSSDSVQCSACGKSYKTREHLKAHVARMHPDQVSSRHACPKCDKVYLTKMQLSSHLRLSVSCSGGRPQHPCPSCDRRFPAKAHLRKHVLGAHLKVPLRPWACVTCAKTFVKAKNCWEHVASKHEGWPSKKALEEWQMLKRDKPHLVSRKDTQQVEEEALRGVVLEK